MALLLPAYVYAQEVEVNLDVLEGYAPPPMFGEPTSIVPDAPAAAPAKVIDTTWGFVPTPDKKPPYYATSYVQPVQTAKVDAPANKDKSNYRADANFVDEVRKKHGLAPLSEDAKVEPDYIEVAPQSDMELERPNARDILASIDPESDLPPIKIASAAPAPNEAGLVEPEKERVYAAPMPTIDPAPDVIAITFAPEEIALNDQITPEMTQQILLKTAQNKGMRIELRGFARSEQFGESAERRLSLLRALEVKKALEGKNIDPAIIEIIEDPLLVRVKKEQLPSYSHQEDDFIDFKPFGAFLLGYCW